MTYDICIYAFTYQLYIDKDHVCQDNVEVYPILHQLEPLHGFAKSKMKDKYMNIIFTTNFIYLYKYIIRSWLKAAILFYNICMLVCRTWILTNTCFQSYWTVKCFSTFIGIQYSFSKLYKYLIAIVWYTHLNGRATKSYWKTKNHG